MTDDLERIDEQLRRLRLSGFDETDAWELGSDLRRRAAARGVAVTIEIRIAGSTVFMGGACQHRWEHCVPKVHDVGPRLSITFRHDAR